MAPKAKTKGKAKAALNPASSPQEKAPPDKSNLVNQLKRANAGTYCVKNIKWNEDDTVRLISHRTMKLILFTSPNAFEDDAHFAAAWDDENSIDNAKGATWFNQIVVWYQAEFDKKITQFHPILPGNNGGAPDLWTHFGMFYAEYDPNMVEEEMVLVFRQWFFEMLRDPELRAVPIEKLACNIEGTVEEQERFVKVFFCTYNLIKNLLY